MGEVDALRSALEELELDIERLQSERQRERHEAEQRLNVTTSGGFLAFWLACSWGGGWWGHGWTIAWGMPASLAAAGFVYYPLLLVTSYTVHCVCTRRASLFQNLSCRRRLPT